jgi:hypothetical protein
MNTRSFCSIGHIVSGTVTVTIGAVTKSDTCRFSFCITIGECDVDGRGDGGFADGWCDNEGIETDIGYRTKKTNNKWIRPTIKK